MCTSFCQTRVDSVTPFGGGITVYPDTGDPGVLVIAHRIDAVPYFGQFGRVAPILRINNNLVHRKVKVSSPLYGTVLHPFRFWSDVSDGGLQFQRSDIQLGNPFTAVLVYFVATSAYVDIQFQVGAAHPCFVWDLHQIVSLLPFMPLAADDGVCQFGLPVVSLIDQLAFPPVHHDGRQGLCPSLRFEIGSQREGVVGG